MKKQEFFKLNLPKWSCLFVKGKKVTKNQAAEILIRTDDLHFSCNDRKFSSKLNEVLYGVYAESYSLEEKMVEEFELIDDYDHKGRTAIGKAYDYIDEIQEEYKILDLYYLRNEQIVSSWIGGPHGWCNWEGYIGCSNYNIGKYTTVKEVYDEWKTIAKEFPYLDLRCQLLSGEQCDDDAIPVVEFIVKNGKVKMKKPTESLYYKPVDINYSLKNIFMDDAERGCTLEQFKEALDLFPKKRKLLIEKI